MEILKISEIVKATGGQLICGDENVVINDIVTDSRIVCNQMLFISIKGNTFDGHDFIENAFEAGATGCVTEKDIDETIKEKFKNKCIIKVKNTLKALHDIARYYRKQFDIPFIAITGSVGKTTTKEIISCVIQKRFNVLKTKGNFNNQIGLPLTIFRLNKSHDIGITEMGMSGFGEISKLVSIVKPKIAVITNIGLSHIGKLGSKSNILKAKMEIFEEFDENSVAFLNGDDPMLYSLKDSLPYKIIYYGVKNKECKFRARNVVFKGEDGSSFKIDINEKEYEVDVPIMGEHNIYNCLVAIAIGIELDINMEDIIAGIKEFRTGNMRLNMFCTSSGIKVINDCYNASPASMKTAIDILGKIKSKRKIAILGDMLEMGKWAKDAHIDIGNVLVQKGIDYLITVGYNGKYIGEGALGSGMPDNRVFQFNTNKEVNNFLESFLKQGDVVLIKGSRGMRMENISEHITTSFRA